MDLHRNGQVEEGGRYVADGQWHDIAVSTFHKQAALVEQHVLQCPLVV